MAFFFSFFHLYCLLSSAVSRFPRPLQEAPIPQTTFLRTGTPSNLLASPLRLPKTADTRVYSFFSSILLADTAYTHPGEGVNREADNAKTKGKKKVLWQSGSIRHKQQTARSEQWDKDHDPPTLFSSSSHHRVFLLATLRLGLDALSPTTTFLAAPPPPRLDLSARSRWRSRPDNWGKLLAPPPSVCHWAKSENLRSTATLLATLSTAATSPSVTPLTTLPSRGTGQQQHQQQHQHQHQHQQALGSFLSVCVAQLRTLCRRRPAHRTHSDSNGGYPSQYGGAATRFQPPRYVCLGAVVAAPTISPWLPIPVPSPPNAPPVHPPCRIVKALPSLSLPHSTWPCFRPRHPWLDDLLANKACNL